MDLTRRSRGSLVIGGSPSFAKVERPPHTRRRAFVALIPAVLGLFAVQRRDVV
jgi:hypothetical protein